MKKMVLVFVLVVLCLVTISILLSRRSNEVAPVRLPEVSQINLYHYLSGSLQGGVAAMIETVNRRQKNFHVAAQALDHEAFKSMIHKTLAGSNPPELFSYWAGAKTQELVDQGKLEPLDDIWREASLDSRFSPVVINSASTYNGRKYLLPIGQHVAVFFYNSKVFAKAGLRPPANWAELVEAAEKLKQQGVTPFALGARERWPAQFWFDYLLLRTAGPEYRERLMQGTASYTDLPVKKVFGMWADLLQKGHFNDNANDLDWAEAAQLVCTGEAAATLMGTWAIQLLTGEGCGLKEEEGFDFFVFPDIDPAIAKVAVGPVDGIVVAKDSIHHELAKKLLPFFAESESQKTMSAGSGGFSPSLQVGKEYYSPLRRRILGEVESSQHWAFAYDLATPIAIAEKGMDSFNELIEFPEQYEAILDFLQQEINSLSDKQTKKQ